MLRIRSLELMYLITEILYPLISPHLLTTPSPWQSPNYSMVPMSLAFLKKNSTYKCYHTRCLFFFIWLISLSVMLQICPYGYKWQDFLLF